MNFVEFKLADDSIVSLDVHRIIMVAPVNTPVNGNMVSWTSIFFVDGGTTVVRENYEDFKRNYLGITTIH